MLEMGRLPGKVWVPASLPARNTTPVVGEVGRRGERSCSHDQRPEEHPQAAPKTRSGARGIEDEQLRDYCLWGLQVSAQASWSTGGVLSFSAGPGGGHRG